MITFLLNIKNQYYHLAVTNIVQDLMNETNNLNYTIENQWDIDSLAKADIIFMDMVAGEWYLCNRMFQQAKENFKLIIIQDDKFIMNSKKLPNCLQSASFMPPHTSVSYYKEEIGKLLEDLRILENKKINKNLYRCIGCRCKSLTEAQKKVIYAFNVGLSPREIGSALQISHKTVYAHKKSIMNRFKLKSRYEFSCFVQRYSKQ
ncbi:TPA: helix-turn-helix transcriptional regulator [Klebsiella pneumoniae]